MLIIISPSKKLDFKSKSTIDTYTQPQMLKQSQVLIDVLSKKSKPEIQKMMGISEILAELNVDRFQHWSRPFRPSNAKQAILAFKGDVFSGLAAEKFTARQLAYAQDHLRILSGLYGVLRPLDLMQAYRLEMGIKLANSQGKNLYEFWGSGITNNINKELEAIDSKILLNLASVEYFKSIDAKSINAQIVSPIFRDWSNGQYKVVGFYAKKARGTMSAWVLKNRVKTLNKLTKFEGDGYRYSPNDSEPLKPVFLRE